MREVLLVLCVALPWPLPSEATKPHLHKDGQAATVGGVTRGAPVVAAVNATAITGPRQLLQRAGMVHVKDRTEDKPVKKSALTKTQEEAFLKGYTLQFVGLDDTGIEPRDTMDDKAKSRCLIGIGPDNINGGDGISFGKCPHFMKKNKFGVPVGGRGKEPSPNMLFQFTFDGRIRHVQTGKCIRRMKCGPKPGPLLPDRPFIYDLGFCDEKAAAKFKIYEARANRADKIEEIGNPLNGVEGPCDQCGPFKLQQYCTGSCDSMVLTTGWTKQPSSFLIPEPEGQKPVFLKPGPFEDGLCGSYLKDDDDTASWFYFHKYDLPKSVTPAKAVDKL